MIICVNNYDVGVEALPTPTITLLLQETVYVWGLLIFYIITITRIRKFVPVHYVQENGTGNPYRKNGTSF